MRKVLAKTIARYGHVDLLCFDELGSSNRTVAVQSCCSRFLPSARKRTPLCYRQQ